MAIALLLPDIQARMKATDAEASSARCGGDKNHPGKKEPLEACRRPAVLHQADDKGQSVCLSFPSHSLMSWPGTDHTALRAPC